MQSFNIQLKSKVKICSCKIKCGNLQQDKPIKLIHWTIFITKRVSTSKLIQKIQIHKIIIQILFQKVEILLWTLQATQSQNHMINNKFKTKWAPQQKIIFWKVVLSIGKLTIKRRWQSQCQRHKMQTGTVLRWGLSHWKNRRNNQRNNHTKTDPTLIIVKQVLLSINSQWVKKLVQSQLIYLINTALSSHLFKILWKEALIKCGLKFRVIKGSSLLRYHLMSWNQKFNKEHILTKEVTS